MARLRRAFDPGLSVTRSRRPGAGEFPVRWQEDDRAYPSASDGLNYGHERTGRDGRDRGVRWVVVGRDAPRRRGSRPGRDRGLRPEPVHARRRRPPARARRAVRSSVGTRLPAAAPRAFRPRPSLDDELEALLGQPDEHW